MADAESTLDGSYTERLNKFQGARWKQLLNVQAPYQWKLRKLLGNREVLDVGCGIGRNLVSLGPGSVGVDHNEHSVKHCRDLGMTAYTPDEFFASKHGGPGSFNGLLAAHLVEHLDRETALQVVGSYLPSLRPGSTVVVITPQELGYASDATHVRFCGFDEVAELCTTLGLTVRSHESFPFPRAAGKAFKYNEFVTVAQTP
ncbi:class I SAM-dependent methyltransferase [Pseudonocardia spinosispora]|uniref:class I SAM-dependent methyltransferase n=1 Tax=Pseudonocardia spinosispora TaxID=103441 RepID=UPI00040B0388|nr:class I SAM-dependent methyltransferase [Pseudonocardia spinosispora]